MTQNFSNNFPNTRMRRIRQSKWIRNLIEENTISSNDMIWPIFLNEGSNVKEEITTMPGVFRYSVDNLNDIVDIFLIPNSFLIRLKNLSAFLLIN